MSHHLFGNYPQEEEKHAANNQMVDRPLMAIIKALILGQFFLSNNYLIN